MKEIEILWKLAESRQEAEAKLKSIPFLSQERVVDVYYYNPATGEFGPDDANGFKKCLRVRTRSGKAIITMKEDHFDGTGIWQYSDEWETGIESAEMLDFMLKRLGLTPLVAIDNDRRYYGQGEYEIVLEDVKGVGLFMEIEKKNAPETIDVALEKKEIRKMAVEFGFKRAEELNCGKPEYVLRKRRP